MSTEIMENLRPASGTSAGGSLISKLLPVVCVAGALSIQGTASAGMPANVTPFTYSTNSGTKIPDSRPASSILMEVRRISGMTWDNLARLFGVSRRTLHFWASGKAVNSINEERLHRLLAMLHQIDKGSASENRATIFEAHFDGVIPFDLIKDGKYCLAIERLHSGRQHVRPTFLPLSTKTRSSRTPTKPDRLVDALHDKVHRGTGQSRTAKARRKVSRTKSDES